MSNQRVDDHPLVIAEDMQRLGELTVKIFAQLDHQMPLHWLCDEPVWESMLWWFGDPRFVVPEFSWN